MSTLPVEDEPAQPLDGRLPADDVPALTLGRQLERSRLEHRARQLERVLERLSLRVRAGSDADQPERAGIRRAIADFARELHEIRRQLGDARGGSTKVAR